ncbi:MULTISPECIES: DUF2750 domain-containing protein [unclassified Hahella]|uniref:DUF2750 domain-containing protein n=1 Tax=unclassified Hahella TaxID=2624107 RepID=UPI001C1E9FAA|nr:MULTISPECIES: DUF2750 domain-containing protein [unclassified Hahella]MBU6954581.1 DUF2750 domain-containing protein [Hahella sp. HN01]MDG9669203.1 DUF2750 domain-containing protein [Hahella sp. CR1]
MNQDQIEQILQLTCDERYDYSLMNMVDSKEVWILINDDNQFLKLFSEEEDFEYLPIWPAEEFAREYANDLGEKLTPKSIALPHFLNKWIPGLQQDGLHVNVFPALMDDSSWIMPPDELRDELKNELSNQM